MTVLFHLSDLHFGPKFVEHLADLILRDILVEKPDLVIVSGDWTLRGRVPEYEQAFAYLQKLPEPVFTIPGNHDQPLHAGGLIARVVRPWGRYEKYIHPTTDRVLNVAGLFVIGLNDNHPLLPGGIWSSAQRKWMERELAKAPPGACKILVMHHQLLWEGHLRPAGQWFPERSLKRLERLGVELILNGHTHVPLTRKTPQNIVIAQAGTAMSTRTRRDRGNSYNRIEVREGTISVDIRVYTLESDRFDVESQFEFPRRGRVKG